MPILSVAQGGSGYPEVIDPECQVNPRMSTAVMETLEIARRKLATHDEPSVTGLLVLNRTLFVHRLLAKERQAMTRKISQLALATVGVTSAATSTNLYASAR